MCVCVCVVKRECISYMNVCLYALNTVKYVFKLLHLHQPLALISL